MRGEFRYDVSLHRHNIPGVDAVVLTHDHADAMLGLDDVRGLQVRGSVP